VIDFVSLFLGLVVGSHPVEVAVPQEVARVELRLDGAAAAVLRAPPWRADVDFGEALAPHELVAVAFDGQGAEVGRARQGINLPRARAEARLVVDADGKSARLVAGNLPHHQLEHVTLTVDDQPLEVPDPSRFDLPRYDRRRLHVLSAELAFAGNLISRLDVPLGSDYGSAVTTDLTAVPLFASRAPSKVGARDLEGLLRRGQEALKVVSTDTGRGEIVVVIEGGALLNLGELGLALDRGASEATRDNPRHPSPLPGSRGQRLRPGERLRFVATTAAESDVGPVAFDLFDISQPFSGADGDLPFLLTHVAPGKEGGGERTADAVAAAAVQAAAGNRPRALVLILGSDGADPGRSDAADCSRFTVAEVERFLGLLRVPLRVWTVPHVPKGLDRASLGPTADTPWGKAAQITTLGRLQAATEDLRQLLDSQVIAWVEGTYLPQEIELDASAKGLELAR
jgi:hypothetical protein